jgi:GNAT superfamily N-acetyltransferase
MSIHDTTIRPILEADAEYVAKLLRATGWFADMAGEAQRETELRIRGQLALCAGDDNHSILVAEDGTKNVLGYASVHWLPSLFLPGPEGFLSELFVAETHRGRGIGRELLQVIAREARRRNCSRLMLNTSRSRESYERRFYSKLGWTERTNIVNFVLDL